MNNGFGVSPVELLASDAMLKKLIFCDEFTYSASWVANTTTELGAGQTVDITIQINGDSDFIVQEQNIAAVDDDLPIFPNYLLTVTRAGSGRQIMSSAQHVANICGGYWGVGGDENPLPSSPGRKPMPGIWIASNTVTVTLQNLTSNVPDRVDLAFVGFKIFYNVNMAQGRKQIFDMNQA